MRKASESQLKIKILQKKMDFTAKSKLQEVTREIAKPKRGQSSHTRSNK